MTWRSRVLLFGHHKIHPKFVPDRTHSILIYLCSAFRGPLSILYQGPQRKEIKKLGEIVDELLADRFVIIDDDGELYSFANSFIFCRTYGACCMII